MGSDETQDESGERSDALRTVWDLYEDSETIGDFHLTKGWGPKPIQFTPFNYRMWRDYQWSLTIAPPPISPFLISGI